MNKTLVKTVIAAALLGTAATASADTAAEAAQRGKADMKAGKVHEACDEFAASDKLDAKIETELDLAACYAEDGKLVSAARVYRLAADKDTKTDRKKASTDKAAKLEAKAPKLRLVLSQKPDNLKITVDGEVVANTGDIPVDAGPHEVLAAAPNIEGHAKVAVDGSRPIVDVIVRMEQQPEAAPPTVAAATVTPAPAVASAPAPEPVMGTPVGPIDDTMPSGHRRRNGIIVGVVGLGVLATGVVFLAASSSKFDDEHALCPNATCATSAQVTQYNSFRDTARTERGTGIGMGIGGLAIVGVGIYLIATSHKSEASHMALNVSHDGGVVGYSGSF